MLRVGLTGGAAGGKSAVAAILRGLGAFVSQSDEVARVMMQPGEPLFQAFVDHFGPEVLRSDGHLDRRMLARIAFHDGRVEELNALVHPPVIAAQQNWLRQTAAEHPEAVAVVESALLLETRCAEPVDRGSKGGVSARPPWRARFDRIVLVTAPEKLRLARYIARALAFEPSADRDALERDARLRFAVQMPEEEKAALADVVIRNEGSEQELRARVEALYRDLLAEARDRAAPAM